MFTLRINADGIRRDVVTEINNTPRACLAEENIDVSGTHLSFDGVQMSASDLGKTFADLGATEGGTSRLFAVVKADGGAK